MVITETKIAGTYPAKLSKELQEIEIKLQTMGFALAGTLLECKNFNDNTLAESSMIPSRFNLSLFNGGQHLMAFEYSQGVGYHVHKKTGKNLQMPHHGSKITLYEYAKFKEFAPGTPTLANVLYSLHSDAGSVDGYTFREWCDCFGYDDDSIKANKMYLACQDTFSVMRPYLNELVEIFEDF